MTFFSVSVCLNLGIKCTARFIQCVKRHILKALATNEENTVSSNCIQ